MQYHTKSVYDVVKFRLPISLHGGLHHFGYLLGLKTTHFADLHACHKMYESSCFDHFAIQFASNLNSYVSMQAVLNVKI
jgi:hypothetical protein